MGNICNVEPLQAQGTVVVDSAQSISSENPLQNKVVTVEKANASALCVDLSGNPITFEADSQAVQKLKVVLEPIQDLHGYDKPWVGGAGKNILPVTLDGIKSLNTSGTWSGNVYTLNNVEYTVETNDGGNAVDIKVNGTASASGSFRVGIMQASGTLKVVGCPQGGDFTNGYSLGIYRPTVGTIGYDEGNGTTFEFNNTSEDIRIVVRQGTQCNNLIFKPMVSADTSVTYATAEPYTNICPISGRTETGVVANGRNLFDKSSLISGGYKNGVLTTSSEVWHNKIAVKPNDVFTISGEKNWSQAWNSAVFLDANDNVLSSSPNHRTSGSGGLSSSYIVTAPENSAYMCENCYIPPTPTTETTTKFDDSLTIQIERGSSATDYVPYKTPVSCSIQFGQTVYGGTVDFKTGKVTVTHKFMTVSSASSPITLTDAPKYQPSGGAGVNLCDKLIYRYSLDNEQHFYFENNKAYLRGNGVGEIGDIQLCYPLATPTELTLTPQELQLLKGYNYITADGNINISLVPENVIDYVMGQIISAMGTDESGRTTASRAYTTGEYFYKDGKMYKALTSIASGATFTVGTNCSQTTIFAELKNAQN